jgi:hypothetical protein
VMDSVVVDMAYALPLLPTLVPRYGARS